MKINILSLRGRGNFPGKTFARFLAIAVSGMVSLGATLAQASDPIGVFALVQKVAIHTNETAPSHIQVWGAFVVADKKDNNSYQGAKTGYLYYKLPEQKPEVALKEWNDLKNAAGSGEIVGFGARWDKLPTVRDGKEKLTNPDTYSLGFGLVKNRRKDDYAPILELRKIQEGKSSKVSQTKTEKTTTAVAAK